MSELRDLYQQMILDHGKRPRNFGELSDADGRADGKNPLCGDKLTVFVKTRDGTVGAGDTAPASPPVDPQWVSAPGTASSSDSDPEQVDGYRIIEHPQVARSLTDR